MCVCVCVCRVNCQEDIEKKACGEFPRGPRLVQGEMSGAPEVKTNGERDGGDKVWG